MRCTLLERFEHWEGHKHVANSIESEDQYMMNTRQVDRMFQRLVPKESAKKRINKNSATPAFNLLERVHA
jgi:hypothetical protein